MLIRQQRQRLVLSVISNVRFQMQILLAAVLLVQPAAEPKVMFDPISGPLRFIDQEMACTLLHPAYQLRSKTSPWYPCPAPN